MNMKIMMGLVLKRELKNYKLKDVARETGVSPSLLSDWKEGGLPSGKNMVKVALLAEFFGLSLSEILFDKKELNVSRTVIDESVFKENGRTYKVIIEKIGP